MKPYYSIHALALIFSLFMIACDSDYGMPEPYTPYMEDAPDYKSKVYIVIKRSPLTAMIFRQPTGKRRTGWKSPAIASSGFP